MTNPIPFAGCFSESGDTAGRPVFVGLPDDSRSSYRPGAAQGPQALRIAYDGQVYNSTSESGVDLWGSVPDLGDWQPAQDWNRTYRRYRRRAEALYEGESVPFFVGGDHAVTVPVVDALQVLNEPVDVIQFDAHPDLYSEYQGDPYSHACTAARLLEMEHVKSLTQLGVRAMNPLQEEQSRRYPDRLRIVEARHLTHDLPYPEWIAPSAAVYVTLDIDVLDPAFAPGVAHPLPGGLSSRQLLNWIQGFPWGLAAMDLVELNPSSDAGNRTAVLAGRLLHEAMALIHRER